MASRKDPSFMNGVPELLILRLLAAREMYGYELVGAIGRATGDVIELGEGCVYPILHGMEKRGLLACRRKDVDGRSRLYYRLTAKGRTRLDEVVSNWRRFSGAIDGLLGAKDANVSGA